MKPNKPYKSTLRKWRVWLAENNEFWGVPVALLSFLVVPYLLQWLDPTAGSFDAGVLHALFFGVVAFVFLKGVVWGLLAMDFPSLYRYLDKYFHELFAMHAVGRLSPGRGWLALCVYALYFVIITLLTIALL